MDFGDQQPVNATLSSLRITLSYGADGPAPGEYKGKYTRIPKNIGELSGARVFLVAYAPVIGEIPKSVMKWTKIQLFDIFVAHEISGSFPDLSNQQKFLKRIYLEYTKVNGFLPESWGSIENSVLDAISVGNNNATGTLPTSWSNLTSLKIIAVNENPHLTGYIPIEYGTRMERIREIWTFGTGINVTAVTLPPQFIKEEKDVWVISENPSSTN